jgi:hypothetical protein
MQEKENQSQDYDIDMEFEEPEMPKPTYNAKPEKLSEDNLSKLGGSKKAPSTAKKSKKSSKPAWAVTPK